MSNSTDLENCSQCRKKYDTDHESRILDDECRLPISCTSCCYTFCYACVRKLHLQQDQEETTVVSCPRCKHISKAFDLKYPFVNTFACQLMIKMIQSNQNSVTPANNDVAQIQVPTKSPIVVTPVRSRPNEEEKITRDERLIVKQEDCPSINPAGGTALLPDVTQSQTPSLLVTSTATTQGAVKRRLDEELEDDEGIPRTLDVPVTNENQEAAIAPAAHPMRPLRRSRRNIELEGRAKDKRPAETPKLNTTTTEDQELARALANDSITKVEPAPPPFEDEKRPERKMEGKIVAQAAAQKSVEVVNPPVSAAGRKKREMDPRELAASYSFEKETARPTKKAAQRSQSSGQTAQIQPRSVVKPNQQQQQQQQRSCKASYRAKLSNKTRSYMEKLKTKTGPGGAEALLKALYDNVGSDGDRKQTMTIEQLNGDAQAHTTRKMVVQPTNTDGYSYDSGWSSMRTLLKHALVERTKSKLDTFALTEVGKNFCRELLQPDHLSNSSRSSPPVATTKIRAKIMLTDYFKKKVE